MSVEKWNESPFGRSCRKRTGQDSSVRGNTKSHFGLALIAFSIQTSDNSFQTVRKPSWSLSTDTGVGHLWRMVNMPKFVIEREVPGAGKRSEAELREAVSKSLEALRKLGPEIRWIQSWVTDDKIYCMYYAPDESLILEHARLIGGRVDRVAAVRRMVDPANFE
jgi:hypothetical protein